jgi:hypothetical protein
VKKPQRGGIFVEKGKLTVLCAGEELYFLMYVYPGAMFYFD